MSSSSAKAKKRSSDEMSKSDLGKHLEPVSDISSATRANAKKKVDFSKFDLGKHLNLENEMDSDIFSDLKGITSALRQVKEKAKKDGQKKNEHLISRLCNEEDTTDNDIRKRQEINNDLSPAISRAADIKLKIAGYLATVEMKRLLCANALEESSVECERILLSERKKLKRAYKEFKLLECFRLRNLKDIFLQARVKKEKILDTYEQKRIEEEKIICEYDRAFSSDTEITNLSQRLLSDELLDPGTSSWLWVSKQPSNGNLRDEFPVSYGYVGLFPLLSSETSRYYSSYGAFAL